MNVMALISIVNCWTKFSQFAYPQPCPVGSYSEVTGLEAEYNCTACTEGEYCDVTNLTAPVSCYILEINESNIGL